MAMILGIIGSAFPLVLLAFATLTSPPSCTCPGCGARQGKASCSDSRLADLEALGLITYAPDQVTNGAQIHEHASASIGSAWVEICKREDVGYARLETKRFKMVDGRWWMVQLRRFADEGYRLTA